MFLKWQKINLELENVVIFSRSWPSWWLFDSFSDVCYLWLCHYKCHCFVLFLTSKSSCLCIYWFLVWWSFGSFPDFLPASILNFTSSIVSLSPFLLFAFSLLIIQRSNFLFLNLLVVFLSLLFLLFRAHRSSLPIGGDVWVGCWMPS